MRTGFAAFVLLSSWCFIGIQALAVVSPTSSTVWSSVAHPDAAKLQVLTFISSLSSLDVLPLASLALQTPATAARFSGGRNIIEWSFLPLTNPPPASDLFDIYLRQNAGGLYDPPLNISIATSINSQTHSSLSFPLTGQLKSGGQYQIFLSAPGNAAISYAESAAFSVGMASANTPTAGPSISQVSIATTVSVAASSTSSLASPTGLAAVQEQGGLSAQGGGSAFVSAAGAREIGAVVGAAALLVSILVI